MDPLEHPKETTPEQDKLYRQMEENAQGVIIELDSVPTSDEKLLEPNQVGNSGDKVYWNVGGVVRELAAPEVGTSQTYVVIDNVDTVEITDLDKGYDYLFSFQNVAPQNDGVILWLRTSSNNGTSFDSGANDYLGIGGSIAQIPLNPASQGNAANETLSLDILVYNPADTNYTHVTNAGGFSIDGAGGLDGAYAYNGWRKEAAAVNAVQFKFDTGQLKSGTLVVSKRVRS